MIICSGTPAGVPFLFLLMTYSVTDLRAINTCLASVGQAPVTTVTADANNGDIYDPDPPTNPNVAMVWNAIQEVSREVQSEGWTFNTENHFPINVNGSNQIEVPANVLQMELTDDWWTFDRNRAVETNAIEKTYTPDAVMRDNGGTAMMYDKANHTYLWNYNPTYFDMIWLRNFDEVPPIVLDFIVARAASLCALRMLGDGTQYQLLQQRELYCRAQAMQYETSQGDYSYFGAPPGGFHYRGYQPFQTLSR